MWHILKRHTLTILDYFLRAWYRARLRTRLHVLHSRRPL